MVFINCAQGIAVRMRMEVKTKPDTKQKARGPQLFPVDDHFLKTFLFDLSSGPVVVEMSNLKIVIKLSSSASFGNLFLNSCLACCYSYFLSPVPHACALLLKDQLPSHHVTFGPNTSVTTK